MSITKGAMLISNANAVGTELVNQLGGTGYKPVEWSDKINLLGINSVDAPYAIKSIQAGTYTGEERGAIQYSNCNAVGSMLNKKFSTDRGFKPVEWESAIKVLKPLTENTVSGDICNVSDGADRVPIKSWEVEIAPTLTGKSAIECTQTGKNLAGELLEWNASNRIIAPVFLKNGTYTVSFQRSVAPNAIYIRKGDTIFLSGDAYATKYNSTSFTFTADESTYYYVQLYRSASSTTWEDAPVTKPQIEVGSTATAYEPYTAPTVSTVNLGRTIYGGSADVVNGTGTIGYALFTKNTADMNNSESYPGWKDQGVRTICGGGLNQEYEDGVTSSGNGYGINTLGSSNDILYLPKSMHNNMTQTDWIALAIDITFVIPLATPTDFTFTPITPTPETVENCNFWNDTGSNTITYYQAPTALTRSTVSGSIASFSDADTRLTCVNAIATIPPSISGVDTVQLVDAGVNLWEFGDVELNVTQGYVMKYLTTPLPAGNYVVSTELTSTTNKCQLRFRKDDGSAITQITFDANIGRTSVSFNLSETAYRIYVYAGLQQPGYVTTWSNVQLEPGSTATTYTPYVAPTTYTANLPSTNYGGSVDFVNGGVKYGEAKIKFNELSWAYNAGYGRFQSNDLISVIKTPSSNDVPLDGLIAEGYITTVASVGSAQDMGIAVTTVSGYVLVYDSRYTDVTTFLQAEGEKNIVYPLVTPTTASITGQAIIPKTGTNNCYNNVGGNTEITYFTNT